MPWPCTHVLACYNASMLLRVIATTATALTCVCRRLSWFHISTFDSSSFAGGASTWATHEALSYVSQTPELSFQPTSQCTPPEQGCEGHV